MNYNPDKHHRRSIRLKGYDYRKEGAYYVTICCHQRRCLLGEILQGVMHPNAIGQTVKIVWNNLPHHFTFIELDVFVLIPNHIHGIIIITDNQNNNQTSNSQPENLYPNTSPYSTDNPILLNCTQSGSLRAIIKNFKSVR